MKRIFVFLFCCNTYFLFAQTNYQKAWEALNKNKWNEAATLLQNAQQDASTFKDAYITKIYLESYRGKESEIRDFANSFYSKVDNPYPYIYALWFNASVAGDYSKKQYDHQLNLLNLLLKDEKAPGTLACAANYQLGMHYLFSNNIKRSNDYFSAINSIRNWQYTGPFENLSQSGFYKEYGPYEHPESTAVFKSLTGADVKWFIPAHEINDGWIPVNYEFNEQTAVVYAQNFVNSDKAQQVYCNIGACGSIKVWINDELVFSDSKERITEMDSYVVPCQLEKGTHRVLVQLGFTRNQFPNFIVRFTDDKFHSIPGITGSSVYSTYPSKSKEQKKYQALTIFAEKYFQDNISASPDNLVNYLLLADVYLRNKKITEARNLLETAIQKAPENCLLKMKMAEAIMKEQNRTLLLEEVEKLKQLDPESLLVLELNIKEDLRNQKYDELEKELEKRISLYGEDESTAEDKIVLLSQLKKYEELIKEVERLYTKFPTNPEILEMMYAVKKNVDKDNKGAMAIFENYMKSNYNYSVYSKYIDVLTEQGENSKALEIRRKLAEDFPYSPAEYYYLSKYYYSAKQYDNAEDYIRKSLAISPYNERYWEQLGDIKSEKKNSTEALAAYNESLKYDPNQYTIINKMRKLNGKEEAYKLFPQVNIDELAKADKIEDAKNIDYGYYYILDQKDVIMYPGGATEQYYTTLIRITNAKGVDKYKESSISYSSNSQTLLIEKAEVIKKNNVKIEGEKNDNEIVFTNLEPGDIIVFKYRIRSYYYGRFENDFWDYYYFGGQIYTVTTRYNLMLPSNQKVYYQFTKGNVQPVVKDVENFKQYSWELIKAEPDKDEPLMPVLCDVTSMLHISTIPGWKDIANWYSDISNKAAEDDVEAIALYKKLFPESGNQKTMTQFEKAKIIYDYIEKNIRYSSVPFRQGAYVPQRPSLTLTTRLGDCKDLSSLFVTLARMAGINAQMVLVNTRDNGQKQILLPSIEFNHCIIKAELDKKKYYIELTDNYLPFASLPNDLNGATILEIPVKSSNDEKAELQFLQAENKTKDIVKRIVNVKPNGSDLDITVNTVKYGNPSSVTRSTYENLDYEKQVKEMESSVAQNYKNNVRIIDVKFSDLDKLNDSVVYFYTYKVKNEIAEIGSLKTFRMVYPDIIASLDNFSADTRSYPINYWSYEDIDRYETVVNIESPAGTKFIELPASESFSFHNMKFSLQYTLKAPNKLTIVRKFYTDRNNIPATDYVEFKNFFEKIIKAEQKFIAYK